MTFDKMTIKDVQKYSDLVIENRSNQDLTLREIGLLNDFYLGQIAYLLGRKVSWETTR